jgi:hypothetical protein
MFAGWCSGEEEADLLIGVLSRDFKGVGYREVLPNVARVMTERKAR